MKEHLRDNHGSQPIWAAFIIAFVAVLIFCAGMLLIFNDSPIVASIVGWWHGFTAWLRQLFRFSMI